uniref:Large polyvalent protein associated domain-containing protein n=1 Tax=Prevotella sp. GTC17254 TaxID=3236794 RepID=A0AB33J3C2_9BACT
MERKNQHFTELEYCFGQYFSKYCAPVIAKDYKYYNRKQAEEYNKAYNDLSPLIGAGSVVPGVMRVQMANTAATAHGKWSKMNLDDFINGVVNKIATNKNFQKDWGSLIDRYRESLVAKLGTKGYIKVAEKLGKTEGQKFIDPAIYYGQIRFVELVKEHLAKTNMPKSSLEYILQEGMNSSIMTTLVNKAIRGRSLSPSEEEVHNIGNKLYKPSNTEKGTAFVLGAVLDAPVLDGIGSVAAIPLKATAKKASGYAIKNGAAKIGTWLGEKATYKEATKAAYVKGLIFSATVGAGLNCWASSKINLDEAKKQYSNVVFGNEDTLGKYQKGALGYRKNGTEYISNVNDGLSKKIKVSPMRPHVSNVETRKETLQLMTAANGNSSKLLQTISVAMRRQAIPYNSNSPLPEWMSHKTAKQCRFFASSFFSIAKQMSVQGLRVWNLNGKNMTLAQVAQRAIDYARTAVQIDKSNAEKQAARAASYSRNVSEPRQKVVEQAKGHNVTELSDGTVRFPSQASVSNTVEPEQKPTQSLQNISMTTDSPYSNMPPMTGWGKYLDNAGMNGFGDVAKNLGYIFAMLPDMLIGMFTGKTSSFTIGNNILPLAAIAAGMFSRNPLLKLMLMGFGGVNILNNAGHEALGMSEPKSVAPRNYKQYADEPLNPRLSNVFMRGRSLIADIDNRPVIINISDNAVDAFEKNALPLNTLANAVLRKYDESKTAVSNSYDRNMAALESLEKQRVYGLK